jgi:hypothetical protein
MNVRPTRTKLCTDTWERGRWQSASEPDAGVGEFAAGLFVGHFEDICDCYVPPVRADDAASVRERLFWNVGSLYATGGAAVVVVVRWWLSSGRRVFHMTPDEPRQLAYLPSLTLTVVRTTIGG